MIDPLHANPMYFIFLAPAFLLGMWAQYRVKSQFAQGSKVPAKKSGAAAAREILDIAGLTNVKIEQVGGMLTDHYDPRTKVLRLSEGVYNARTAAAVGIAGHEAGHAIQDAERYGFLVVRNAVVPFAGIGSNLGIMLIVLGFAMSGTLMLVGIALYSIIVFFQVVNLPVEFDASNRAKQLLPELRIAGPQEMTYVNKVLNAAAWTYVAATLSSIGTVLYYILQLSRAGRQRGAY
ncbi:Peptidase membrane zinc metallopeptidase [Planctomycetales bacterium 10988]|nr:Peptidase membrane zinc metallopeptidase [Planctomycetales bacterium 10988]